MRYGVCLCEPVYVCMYVCVYIYIYVERERGGDGVL